MEGKKKCTGCKIEKLLLEFKKSNTCKNGINSKCKSCCSKLRLKNKRTRIGLSKCMYQGQIKSSKSRKHPLPNYNILQFQNWLFSQSNFEDLFVDWKISDYNSWKIPSVDRIDNNIHYTLDNIQLMTWEENRLKQSEDLKSGNLIHGDKPQKAVIGTNIITGETIEFVSASQAGRILGCNRRNIQANCTNKRANAFGYIWKYKENKKI
jgi:hypothetical protein